MVSHLVDEHRRYLDVSEADPLQDSPRSRVAHVHAGLVEGQDTEACPAVVGDGDLDYH